MLWREGYADLKVSTYNEPIVCQPASPGFLERDRNQKAIQRFATLETALLSLLAT